MPKTTVQYVADFQNDPRTLVKFMKNNWVRMRNTKPVSLYPGYVRFIEDATPAVLRRRGLGTTWDMAKNVCYALEVSDTQPVGQVDYLTAYWCGYQAGEVRSAVLGNDYDFVFTALVNGCTIGLGSRANGARLMTHANKPLADNSGMDMAQMIQMTDQEMTANLVTAPDHLLEFPDYNTAKASVRKGDGNDGSINALIFGIRVGQDDWKMYYERHNQNGVGPIRVQYGVKKIN